MKTAVSTYNGESIKAVQDGGTIVLTMPLQQARGLANQCRQWYTEAKAVNHANWEGSNSPQGLVLDTLLGIITQADGEAHGVTLYDAPTITRYASSVDAKAAVAPRTSKKEAKRSLKVGFKYMDGKGEWHEVVGKREEPNLGYGYEARSLESKTLYSFTSDGRFLIHITESVHNLILSSAKRIKGGA